MQVVTLLVVGAGPMEWPWRRKPSKSARNSANSGGVQRQ